MKTRSLNNLFLAASFLLFTGIASAQVKTPPPPPQEKGPHDDKKQNEKRENIEAMKVAFLTTKLDLTPEEAQQFWPVYNQYTEKIQELRKKRRQDSKDARHNFDQMSDKDVEAAVDNEMMMRQKELDIQKEYHSKFKAVLPIKKVAKLYQAEEQFKRVLLDKLRDGPPARDN